MKRRDEIDALLSYLEEHTPKTVYLIKNKPRYDEVTQAIKKFADFVWAVDDKAKITVRPDDLTGTSICVEVITNLVVIDMVDDFCDVLRKANNFEVYPRTDGKIGLGLVFERAFDVAPPTAKKKS